MSLSYYPRRLALVTLLMTSSLTALAQVNLRVDPLRALTGAVNVDLDIGLTRTWTLGPTAQFSSQTDGDFKSTAYGFGLRANYYFGRNVFTEGWYLGPSVSYVNATVKSDDDFFGDLEGNASGVAATALIGYQWMWESFNINLGAGPVYYSIGDIEVTSEDNNYREEFSGFSGGGLAIEFTLG